MAKPVPLVLVLTVFSLGCQSKEKTRALVMQEKLREPDPHAKIAAAHVIADEAALGNRELTILLPDLLQTIAVNEERFRPKDGGPETSPSDVSRRAVLAMRPPPVPELIGFLGKEHKWAIQGAAATVLGEMKAKEAVPALAALLEEPDEFSAGHLQYKTMHALGQIGDPRAVAPLVAYARRDPKQCNRAIPSVAMIPGRETADALLAVAGDATAPCREAALGSLGKTGDSRAAPLLIAAMKDKGLDADLRQTAALALGDLREPRVVEALIEALESCRELREPDSSIPNWMAHSLKRLTGQELGESRAAWQTWWTANAATFK
jgi:hypothetical protein